MKNNSESLKLLARRAKRRLKGDVAQIRSNIVYEAENTIDSPEDKQLIERIKDVLKNKKDTLAPIGELIDRPKFNMLSSLQRQIYLFDLIAKYNHYKEIYDKEERNKQEHDLVV
ncbi:MAG: hypothetical protein PHX27_04540 [Candidatus ainarchaeum sp.]|nr:hypothetical protein [Candidatus ainarchaeum sp.]